MFQVPQVVILVFKTPFRRKSSNVFGSDQEHAVDDFNE